MIIGHVISSIKVSSSPIPPRSPPPQIFTDMHRQAKHFLNEIKLVHCHHCGNLVHPHVRYQHLADWSWQNSPVPSDAEEPTCPGPASDSDTPNNDSMIDLDDIMHPNAPENDGMDGLANGGEMDVPGKYY